MRAETGAGDSGSPRGLSRSHCAPYVRESRADRTRTHDSTARFDYLEHQPSGQNRYFYASAASEFNELIDTYPAMERLLRPASLEDVFLKLTGREIH